MQTTITWDMGQIATAWAPTGAIIATAIVGWFKWRRDRREDKEERRRQAKVEARATEKILKQGEDTHVLVNDQLTREKATRLLDARTNRAVLAKLMGKHPSKDETALLTSLDAQIESLAAEIEQRDIAAGTLKPGEHETTGGTNG